MITGKFLESVGSVMLTVDTWWIGVVVIASITTVTAIFSQRFRYWLFDKEVTRTNSDDEMPMVVVVTMVTLAWIIPVLIVVVILYVTWPILIVTGIALLVKKKLNERDNNV